MQRLEVSGVIRPIYGSLGVKRLISPASRTNSKPTAMSRNNVESVLNIFNSSETNPMFLVIMWEGSELHSEDAEESGTAREF